MNARRPTGFAVRSISNLLALAVIALSSTAWAGPTDPVTIVNPPEDRGLAGWDSSAEFDVREGYIYVGTLVARADDLSRHTAPC
jgi:hypothetical protein